MEARQAIEDHIEPPVGGVLVGRVDFGAEDEGHFDAQLLHLYIGPAAGDDVVIEEGDCLEPATVDVPGHLALPRHSERAPFDQPYAGRRVGTAKAQGAWRARCVPMLQAWTCSMGESPSATCWRLSACMICLRLM